MIFQLYVVNIKVDMSAAAAHETKMMLLPGPGHPEMSACRRGGLPEVLKSPMRA
jgi:hypothetical protein